MEVGKLYSKHKGGRPAKAVKRNKTIGVRCSSIERCLIESKAKSAGLTRSEYLRIIGLNGKVDMRRKVFPKEVLQGIANLNHLAANLNQIAKKRNGVDELNALERAALQHVVLQIKQFVKDCKNYLQ
jgi:hypothetical protein